MYCLVTISIHKNKGTLSLSFSVEVCNQRFLIFLFVCFCIFSCFGAGGVLNYFKGLFLSISKTEHLGDALGNCFFFGGVT